MPIRICIDCGDKKVLIGDLRSKRCHRCASKRFGGRKNKGWHKNVAGYIWRSMVKNGCRHAEYQHRYVMEQFLGRDLKSDEHIHHINHDKTDNRIENLEITSNVEHLRHHMKGDRAKSLSILGHKKRWGYES